jgi:antitoxin PrlF
MPPMPSAVVTSKGQITIPKRVRDALGVESGDRVDFVETAKGVYELVAASKDVRELKGMIARPRRPVSVEDMRKAVARRASR